MIRFTVFPDEPNALLVFSDDDTDRATVEIAPPFTRELVRAACRAAGIPARVSVGHPGKWTKSLAMARSAARAERGARHNETAALQASVLLGANIADERDRARLIARKIEVDNELRELKRKLSAAKSRAFAEGVYLDRKKWLQLEADIGAKQDESQALQLRLGQLKAAAREGDAEDDEP